MIELNCGDQKAVETNETDNSVNIDDSFNQDNDDIQTTDIDITDSFTSDDDITATNTEETNTDIHLEDSFNEDNSLDLDADLDLDFNDIDATDSGVNVIDG